MSPAETTGAARPLCVDLDGTLIATDALWESLLLLAKRDVLAVPRVLLWSLGGKARMKRQIADRVILDAATLPYRPEVVDCIEQARSAERPVLLVTASDQRIADAVGAHLELFDEVIGSDGASNLKGETKSAYLVERYGKGGFDYIGDSKADLPVWSAASEALFAGHDTSVLNEARKVSEPKDLESPAPNKARALIKAFRPHQWAKNILLFVPAVLAHRFRELDMLVVLLSAFFGFSLCASAVYILNDLLDLEQDRVHTLKSRRPFASAALSIPTGMVLMVFACVTGLSLGLGLVGPTFAAVLTGYLILTTAYSVYLKRMMIIDVIMLAVLFTYRVIAGGVAAQVEVTFWLLAFSLFFFTGLAFAKRYAELVGLQRRDGDQVPGRGYSVSDIDIIKAVGPTTGITAVLVFALYINSPRVRQLYTHPEVLWIMCPVLLYWITRIWFIAGRGQLHEDPIVFALRDKVSYVTGLVSAICLLAAK